MVYFARDEGFQSKALSYLKGISGISEERKGHFLKSFGVASVVATLGRGSLALPFTGRTSRTVQNSRRKLCLLKIKFPSRDRYLAKTFAGPISTYFPVLLIVMLASVM